MKVYALIKSYDDNADDCKILGIVSSEEKAWEIVNNEFSEVNSWISFELDDISKINELIQINTEIDKLRNECDKCYDEKKKNGELIKEDFYHDNKIIWTFYKCPEKTPESNCKIITKINELHQKRGNLLE